MTAVEPKVYPNETAAGSTRSRLFPKEWKLCPLINDGCYGHDCKFWVEGDCLIFKLLIKLLVYD